MPIARLAQVHIRIKVHVPTFNVPRSPQSTCVCIVVPHSSTLHLFRSRHWRDEFPCTGVRGTGNAVNGDRPNENAHHHSYTHRPAAHDRRHVAFGPLRRTARARRGRTYEPVGPSDVEGIGDSTSLTPSERLTVQFVRVAYSSRRTERVRFVVTASPCFVLRARVYTPAGWLFLCVRPWSLRTRPSGSETASTGVYLRGMWVRVQCRLDFYTRFIFFRTLCDVRPHRRCVHLPERAGRAREGQRRPTENEDGGHRGAHQE